MGAGDAEARADDVHAGAFNHWGGRLSFRHRFDLRPTVVIDQPAPSSELAPAEADAPAPPVPGL